MRKLEYSQIVRRKIKELKNDLVIRFDEEVSKRILGTITKNLRSLELFPQKGMSVSSMFDIESDYYYLVIEHNYFFYHIEEKRIIVLDMFNEKEDFMYKLFGVKTISQETLDFWDE